MSEQPSCRYVMGLTSDGEISSASADVEGLACGVGGKPFLTERLGVRLDASRYEGDDSEADLFTIGGVVKF